VLLERRDRGEGESDLTFHACRCFHSPPAFFFFFMALHLMCCVRVRRARFLPAFPSFSLRLRILVLQQLLPVITAAISVKLFSVLLFVCLSSLCVCMGGGGNWRMGREENCVRARLYTCATRRASSHLATSGGGRGGGPSCCPSLSLLHAHPCLSKTRARKPLFFSMFLFAFFCVITTYTHAKRSRQRGLIERRRRRESWSPSLSLSLPPSVHVCVCVRSSLSRHS
jgi:hypothetical protein